MFRCRAHLSGWHRWACGGLQACAALEKQLKFASDRLERADEEKKELQEVLRAWEAENLRCAAKHTAALEQEG